MKFVKTAFLIMWPKALRRWLWSPIPPDEIDESIDQLRAFIPVSAVLGFMIFTPLVILATRRGLDRWDQWAQSGFFVYGLLICIITFFRARFRLSKLEKLTPNKPEAGNGVEAHGQTERP